MLTVTIIDGGRGDSDGMANGVAVDPGGEPTTTLGTGPGGPTTLPPGPVVPPSGGLPATGGAPGMIVAVATLLVLLGAVLVTARRRVPA